VDFVYDVGFVRRAAGCFCAACVGAAPACAWIVNGARDVFLGLIIVILGCQLAKCPTAKIRPRIFRPTGTVGNVKSLIARKDRGAGRVDLIDPPRGVHSQLFGALLIISGGAFNRLAVF
jgi:hypothetical protein